MVDSTEVSRQLAREIALDCQEVLLNFLAHVDAGEYREMEKYFAHDGLWRRVDGDIRGVDELRARFMTRSAGVLTRHVVTNFITTVIDANTAAVRSYITAYRHDPREHSPQQSGTRPPRNAQHCMVLTCKDELVRIDGVWKIRFRQATPDLVLETG